MRQSPPRHAQPGLAFTMRLRQLRTLLSEGIESGDIRIEDSPSLSMLARYVMDALWVPEKHRAGSGQARGAAQCPRHAGARRRRA